MAAERKDQRIVVRPPLSYSDKTITQTNFFECREVTNCEFIYEQSDKSNLNNGGRAGGSGVLSTISGFFSRGNSYR